MKCFHTIILLSFAFALSTPQSTAQTSAKTIETLRQYGDSILKSPSDTIRQYYATQFTTLLSAELKLQKQFDHSFDSVKNLSILTSDDQRLRVLTYMLPHTLQNQFQYFGFVQINDHKKKQIHTIQLKPIQYDTLQNISRQKIDARQWYGCLYYSLITKKYKRNYTYTLIGYQPNNRLTTRKIIDIISIKGNSFTLGKPIFVDGKKFFYRKVYEYNAQASMLLRYDPAYKMIMMDDIIPDNTAHQGNYLMYGPNFKYNAYRFKKGKWFLQKDVDARNTKEGKPKTQPLQKKFRITKRPDQN
ncbi:MAG TPA: hypothetical protein PKH65_07920 [Bacteroidia bacterium]|nr:hypothetical protein [Bacteroidia bacterium]